jgi:hypothetical protein
MGLWEDGRTGGWLNVPPAHGCDYPFAPGSTSIKAVVPPTRYNSLPIGRNRGAEKGMISGHR